MLRICKIHSLQQTYLFIYLVITIGYLSFIALLTESLMNKKSEKEIKKFLN